MTLTPLYTDLNGTGGKQIEYYVASKKVFFEIHFSKKREEGGYLSIVGGILFCGVEEISQRNTNPLTEKDLAIDLKDYAFHYYVHIITKTIKDTIKTYLVSIGDNVLIIKAKSVELIEDIYIN